MITSTLHQSFFFFLPPRSNRWPYSTTICSCCRPALGDPELIELVSAPFSSPVPQTHERQGLPRAGTRTVQQPSPALVACSPCSALPSPRRSIGEKYSGCVGDPWAEHAVRTGAGTLLPSGSWHGTYCDARNPSNER